MNMKEMTKDTTIMIAVQEIPRLYNKPRQAPGTGRGYGYVLGASFIPSSDLDNIDLRQEVGNPVCSVAHGLENSPVRHGPVHCRCCRHQFVVKLDSRGAVDFKSLQTGRNHLPVKSLEV
jgi:hypothetical protein